MFPATVVLADAEPGAMATELAVTTESRRAGVPNFAVLTASSPE
jgi:hypothetical protein